MDRGLSYWARRAVIFLLLLMVLAVAVGIEVGLYAGCFDSDLPPAG
ncbi:hypothetical protein CLV35_2901 [Motilibacter peucedani]|uniref:Uncharacterized protein n=1 Tax=Motilibacter peucedani TaxID=598650 RepID=A0A420XN01_9ACTN|nr:hypothetical protein [Motilibacter peucedani]RKS72653.1 hypothetical protein CLV35_2901 [Motilibacter peucedani]